MSFSISPTTATSGTTINATGKTARRTNIHILIEGNIVATGSTNNGGNFTATFLAPTGTDRTVDVILEYLRADGAYAQTAKAPLTIKNPVTQPPPSDPIPVITLTSLIPNASGADFKWHVSEGAKGWIEFGFDTNYGRETTHENSFNYQDHVQSITGQPANTTIFYRIVAEDTKAQRGYLAGRFNTTGTISPPPTVPSAPSNLTATPSDKKVTLGWGA